MPMGFTCVACPRHSFFFLSPFGEVLHIFKTQLRCDLLCEAFLAPRPLAPPCSVYPWHVVPNLYLRKLKGTPSPSVSVRAQPLPRVGGQYLSPAWNSNVKPQEDGQPSAAGSYRGPAEHQGLRTEPFSSIAEELVMSRESVHLRLSKPQKCQTFGRQRTP